MILPRVLARPHFEWHSFLSVPHSSAAWPPPCNDHSDENLFSLADFTNIGANVKCIRIIVTNVFGINASPLQM